jgi:MFS family permease
VRLRHGGTEWSVFGMSQFLFQTPAGYLYDYTEQKILWLTTAGILTTLLTVFTAVFAKDYGENLGLMIFIKFVQGAVTSFIPPGLNSITQGIVGSQGMTQQVSVNEMMKYVGSCYKCRL